MTIESEIERSLREELLEFSPKEACSAMADDVESPAERIAGEYRRRMLWKTVGDRKERRYNMHNQVLRIKVEESKIGADLIGDCCDGYVANSHPLDDRLVIWSRLPASPLSRREIDRNNQNRA